MELSANQREVPEHARAIDVAVHSKDEVVADGANLVQRRGSRVGNRSIMHDVDVRQIFIYSIAILATITILPAMLSPLLSLPLLAGLRMATAVSSVADLSWYPPKNNSVNSLVSAINGTGIYGFVFNSSQTPSSLPYLTYNWCNMPHVRPQEYVKPSSEYSLKYVELIHRHHKRTPYAANTFPIEGYPWDCNDSGLFYYGEPLNPAGNSSAPTYWSVFEDAANPYNGQAGRFAGNCEFPQITREGLDDAWQHGKDLYAVYHGQLGLIPTSKDGKAPRGQQGSLYLIDVSN